MAYARVPYWMFWPFFLLLCCKQKATDEKQLLELTDGLGRKIQLRHSPHTVMALAPSMTEMLFFTCDTAQVVAVTRNDNFPQAVQTKPRINTYPAPDAEEILRLKPDIVFTVEGITSLQDAEKLTQLGIPVYIQHFDSLQDIFRSIREIGQIMGHAERSNRLADSLEAVARQFKGRYHQEKPPRVLAITWTDPIYVYGRNTVLTQLLQLAGGENALDSLLSVPYPEVSREYVLKLNPDVIIGNSFEEMDSTFFKRYPELKQVRAYQERRIYELPDDLMARPGPRSLQLVDLLGKRLQSHVTHP
jgi:iron complex transport system substrate-binding protein